MATPAPSHDSPRTDSPAPPSSPKLGATPLPRRSSTETFDPVFDLDLEKRLERRDSSGTIAGEGNAVVVSASSSPGPVTLSHDDPGNPRNWSTGLKVLINFVLCIWVLSLTYSSTAYVASIRALEREFNLSQEGPLIFGPASELFGRRAVYIFAGVFYSAFSLGAAFAPNAAGLLVFRFLLGFFGSASINNVPASIGDFTTPENRNRYSIMYALMAFGGPALGPLCSGFIETSANFHWNLRVMAIFSTFMSLLAAFVPETHGPTLLKWRIAKEGNAPPPLKLGQVVGVYKVALARPLVYLFTEPTVALVSMYLAVLYGILYGFFQGFAVVWIEIRGFSPQEYGLTYISLGLGFVGACVLLATFGNRFYMHYIAQAKAAGTKTQPEARLGLTYFGAILAPVSLFLFAWTAPFPSVHWIVPCLAEFLFGMSMLCIFTGFIPYLIDVYLMTAASALAAGMASRALVGSAFMYHALSVQGATSLLAGLACCLAPIPFVFNKYGPWMRERSKYAIVQQ